MPAPTPFTQALTDPRPRLVPLDPSAPRLPTYRPRADAIQSAQAHTLLVVPPALRDAALGLVSLYRTGKSPPFDEADQKLAVEVAAHTALSIDNARRFTREHAIAATVQRRLHAPKPTPRWRPPTSPPPAPPAAPGTTPSPCPEPAPRSSSATCPGRV
ncbi:GAF domain-containing protein [Streptomyces sp. CB01373]|uniref:GAF domain-containing protein n=1 Tax=Streptomyces sp. CB01373 TaxID=2020325 RepID=UPI001F3CF1CF|nr:GAF domain-containing protein [Streptomyces sp. CB01373]